MRGLFIPLTSKETVNFNIRLPAHLDKFVKFLKNQFRFPKNNFTWKSFGELAKNLNFFEEILKACVKNLSWRACKRILKIG